MVGAFRVWINGPRRLERAAEPVICVVPVDPQPPNGGDVLIETIGEGSGPGDGEMNPTVAPPPNAGTGDKRKPKSKRRKAAVWRSPDGEFILIRIPARGDLPAILRELGLDLRQVELARAYSPALSELRSLANNPDFAPTCQAIGTLARRVPLLLAVSRTVLPYSTFEALVLDGELIYSGDPRRSRAGETKLPVSFDAVFEQVDRAGQCRPQTNAEDWIRPFVAFATSPSARTPAQPGNVRKLRAGFLVPSRHVGEANGLLQPQF